MTKRLTILLILLGVSKYAFADGANGPQETFKLECSFTADNATAKISGQIKYICHWYGAEAEEVDKEILWVVENVGPYDHSYKVSENFFDPYDATVVTRDGRQFKTRCQRTFIR